MDFCWTNLKHMSPHLLPPACLSNMWHLKMLGTLMFLILLCDADSTCGPDENPLFLDPPEVIGKYGESVPVNCTSTDAYHDGMFWTVGNAIYEMTEQIQHFLQLVPLSTWNQTAQCSITVDEYTECSKDLEITIYKTPDTVSVVTLGDGQMMEGTEYQLVCDVVNVAPVRNLQVKWYRGNELVYTEVFGDTSVTPVNVSSTLNIIAQRDNHGELFRCEAELHLGPNGPELTPTVSSPNHTAVVLYKPLMEACPPYYVAVEHEFSMDMLPCQADGNPPPTVQWYFEGEAISASKPLTRIQSGTYTAKAVNKLGYSSTSVDITVEYAPEFKMDTEDLQVHEGDDVSLTCEAEGNPPPTFIWTCNGLNVLENTNNLNISQILTNTTCSCTAANRHGNAIKLIDVHVMQYIHNIPITAVPTAMANPQATKQKGCPLELMPAEVVVRFGDPVSIECSTSDTDALRMGWETPVGGTGFMNTLSLNWTVPNLEMWAIEPMCYVTLEDKQCSLTPRITLYKTPDTVSVVTLGDGQMMEGTEYQLVCDVVNVAPERNLQVKWYRGNELVYTEVFGGTSVTPVNVSSTLNIIAQRDNNGELFRCEAELHLGQNGPELTPTVSSPNHTAVVLYKPLMEACPPYYVAVEHEFSMDMLPCQADGNPPPTVQWYFEGEAISASKPLTRIQSGTYTAKAVNKLGYSSTSVDITVEYAPEFKMDTEDLQVHEGDDVSLTCEAEGNPPPTFIWTCNGLNVLENTNNLNISQILTNTTCSCTAANRHGNAIKLINVHVMQYIHNIPITAVPTAMANPQTTKQKGCPLELMPAEVVVRFGDPVSIECSTSDTDALGMGWETPVGGTGFMNTLSLNWTVPNLEMWAIEPMCYVTLDNIQCSLTPSITLYKTPDTVSVVTLGDGQMMEGTEYQLVCDVVNVAPERNLQVKWYRGNKLVYTQRFGGTSVTPVNVSSTLNIIARRDNNGELFRCEAELHLGPNGPELIPTVSSPNHTAVVLYAPVFKAGNSVVHVAPGENVTFSCHAEGNPDPDIRWYNVSEENVKTISRGMNISITGATSTNAGVYICVATNKVGSVERHDTLVIRGETSEVSFGFHWMLIAVLSTIVFITIITIIVLCNRSKKHGQYSFIPDKAKDGSDGHIPLNNMSKGVMA